jgi:lactoylglutathione lyase
MKIEHVAIWVKDIEGMKTFYEKYFNGQSNEVYHNKAKGFESYFIQFDSGARLEIMRQSSVVKPSGGERLGWAHIAFSLGSREDVEQLTARLSGDGFRLINGPRVTGDGYYESVIEDPEGNQVELTI